MSVLTEYLIALSSRESRNKIQAVVFAWRGVGQMQETMAAGANMLEAGHLRLRPDVYPKGDHRVPVSRFPAHSSDRSVHGEILVANEWRQTRQMNRLRRVAPASQARQRIPRLLSSRFEIVCLIPRDEDSLRRHFDAHTTRRRVQHCMQHVFNAFTKY